MPDINWMLYLIWVLATILAVAVLVAFLYFTDTGRGITLGRAIATIRKIFDEYGDAIKERDKVFYETLKNALETSETALADGDLSFDEKKAIVRDFAPVFRRLFEIIQKKWKGSVLVVETV